VNPIVTLTQKQLLDFLLNVAPVRPVFIWGAPGIGKSALVQAFAESVGLPCVSLLGSQLAPEDLIGVPQIIDGVSRFCPPAQIARSEPFCLFLDELNACSQEVQKAFYSLIHERRIGEYQLPEGSVVIGAGNRAQDAAIVRPMSSALLNRMLHVHLRAAYADWAEWAYAEDLHALVLEYLRARPDHLWSQPPKHEEPFSTPRSWHMLSDALGCYGSQLDAESVATLAYAALSPAHAQAFKSFHKQRNSRFQLEAILAGTVQWPGAPEDRDLLYFLAQALRGKLLTELPPQREAVDGAVRELAHNAKARLKALAELSLEIAQVVVAREEGDALPDWFMVEVIRDLPRLIERKA
jgi:MoxR-like ATPase